MVRCPDCAAAIDLDEDEVEEGEIMTCPECESELEVVSTHPVQLNSLSEDDDDDDDDDSADDDDDEPSDDEEDDEDEEEE